MVKAVGKGTTGWPPTSSVSCHEEHRQTTRPHYILSSMHLVQKKRETEVGGGYREIEDKEKEREMYVVL